MLNKRLQDRKRARRITTERREKRIKRQNEEFKKKWNDVLISQGINVIYNLGW